MAEVIGSAIALQLLFHIPLFYGVLITGAGCALILLLQRWGFRYVEALVIALIGTILVMFSVQVFLSHARVTWTALSSLIIPVIADHHQSRDAVYRDWDSGCDGDAAQSLSAFIDCAEPALQAHAGRASARRFTWRMWIRRVR